MTYDIQVFRKSEIALRQLRMSVQLYYKDEFICSLALAGAAEEILGKIANKNTGDHSLIKNVNFINDQIEKNTKGKLPDKFLINALNQTRNEIKHNDRGNDSYVAAYFKMDAENLIERAIENYRLAFNEYPKDRTIKKYTLCAT